MLDRQLCFLGSNFVDCQSGSWAPVGGSDTASLTQNGYTRLPSGLIIQWMWAASTGSTRNWTFPIPFPNAVLSVTFGQGVRWGTSVATGQDQRSEYVTSISTTGMSSYQYALTSGDIPGYSLVIGY